MKHVTHFENFSSIFKVNKPWWISYESYGMGSEGSGRVGNKNFKSKESALKYLEKAMGKMEPFEHEWNNDKGEWYKPVNMKLGIKRYYCIRKD